ncbi:MAG: hypothetical protein PHW73_13480 [Atribacterota bacterium]|nr:hypothetical protein [Atribacterota bacterium]
MLENEKFKEAYRLLLSIGDKKAASKLFLELAEDASDKVIKINSILAAITALNTVENEQEILGLCNKGIDLAEELQSFGVVSYLMAIKAKNMELEITRYQHQKASLCSALGWFAFTLERDRDVYIELGKRLTETEVRMWKTIDEAIEMAEKSNAMDALGNILMIRGEINGGLYLVKKMGDIKNTRTFLFLSKFHLEDFYFRLFETKRGIDKYIRDAEHDLMRAVEIFTFLKDEQNSAYALFNLANQLRVARKFRKATALLKKVEIVAKKSKNNMLLRSVAELRASIKAKNEDTPDYINGERRQF